MDGKKNKSAYHLIINLGQLLSLIKLYKLEHPMVKEKLNQVFMELNQLTSERKSLTFSESEGVFLFNGEKIEDSNDVTRRFTKSFRALHLSSLEFESGLTLTEFSIFIQILIHPEELTGENQVKEYLKNKGVQHIVPLFATYKLVKENEEIVKEGEIVKANEISNVVIERFVGDLEKGEIAQRLQEEEKTYMLLAHDPVFLSKLMFDLVKERDGTEEKEKQEFEKILWLIGDYLIDEIGNARIEKINRKTLDELRVQLLALWEKQKAKEPWSRKIEESFVKIRAAMQLKGLILLYGKHKKEIETVLKKLKDILETLPCESLLYQKSKEKLMEIGPVSSKNISFFE